MRVIVWVPDVAQAARLADREVAAAVGRVLLPYLRAVGQQAKEVAPGEVRSFQGVHCVVFVDDKKLDLMVGAGAEAVAGEVAAGGLTAQDAAVLAEADAASAALDAGDPEGPVDGD